LAFIHLLSTEGSWFICRLGCCPGWSSLKMPKILGWSCRSICAPRMNVPALKALLGCWMVWTRRAELLVAAPVCSMLAEPVAQ